jgi:hypothetical protein
MKMKVIAPKREALSATTSWLIAFAMKIRPMNIAVLIASRLSD